MKHDPKATVIVWEPFTKPVDIDRDRTNFSVRTTIDAMDGLGDFAINQVNIFDVLMIALITSNVPPDIVLVRLALI